MEAMNDELWRVQLGTGEIRMMTLDGLDRAFDEGLIDANAPVLAPGSSAWTTLGEAAGLDEASTSEETPSLSPVAIAPPSSAAPMAQAPQQQALDADFDLDELELKPRRGPGLIIGGILTAFAVAAASAIVVGKLGGAADVDVKATNAVQAPPAAEPLPPPEAKDSKPTLTFTEEQKKALLDADKAREDKARAKNQEKAEKAGRTPKKKMPKSSSPFVNGGDKFDPLNGAL